MRRKGFFVFAAVTSVFLGGLLLLGSNPAESSHGSKISPARGKPVYSNPDCTGPVEGSFSILDRTSSYLLMRITTFDLDPGAYTNWFVLSGPGIQDNDDNTLVVRATRGIVDEDGRGRFKAIVRVGNYVANGMDVLNSGELVDPMNVDVFYFIRYHGEVVPEFRRDQLSKFLGGCVESGGPNECVNVQFACYPLEN